MNVLTFIFVNNYFSNLTHNQSLDLKIFNPPPLAVEIPMLIKLDQIQSVNNNTRTRILKNSGTLPNYGCSYFLFIFVLTKFKDPKFYELSFGFSSPCGCDRKNSSRLGIPPD